MEIHKFLHPLGHPVKVRLALGLHKNILLYSFLRGGHHQTHALTSITTMVGEGPLASLFVLEYNLSCLEFFIKNLSKSNTLLQLCPVLP